MARASYPTPRVDGIRLVRKGVSECLLKSNGKQVRRRFQADTDAQARIEAESFRAAFRANAKASDGDAKRAANLAQHGTVVADGELGVTIAELLDRHDRIMAGRTRDRSAATRRSIIRRLRKEIGEHDVSVLTISWVREYAISLRDGGGGHKALHPSTVRNYLAVFEAAIEDGVREGLLPVDHGNVVRETKRVLSHKTDRERGVIAVSGERDRVATDDELRRIVAHLREDGQPGLAAMVEFAVLSSWRLTELATLRFCDIDRTHERDNANPRVTASILNQKQRNGAPAYRSNVPVTSSMLKIIDAQWVEGESKSTDYVFPREYKSEKARQANRNVKRDGHVSKLFASAARACSIEDIRFHDLRHTAMTRLAKQGLSVHVLRAFSGHKTLSMVQRYIQSESLDIASQVRSL